MPGKALSATPPNKRAASLFCGTSPTHRQDKLQKSKAEILALIGNSVAYARQRFDIVSFSPEDATRTEPDFLLECIQVAVDSGVSSIGLADTVGVLTPKKTKTFIGLIQNRIRDIDHVLLAVHFHNDLGLAVANSLAAVEAGANIVQCTVNGIGERAGNTPLEEFAVALAMNSKEHGNKTHRLKLEKLDGSLESGSPVDWNPNRTK